MIWCAEVIEGELVRLENGRSRHEVAEHLLELAADDPQLVVGLDFSFSLPAWFLRERGYTSVDELWRAAATDGDGWIRSGEAPFWGRAGSRRPELPAHFRVTEEQISSVGGIRPKSTFQVSGAGSVGAGSVRGFPVLQRLRAGGFTVWPFDAADPPVVVEVWPRMMSGPVVKSRADARARHLAAYAPTMRTDLRDLAIESDDAFDAAVTALAMAPSAASIARLPRATGAATLLEGQVWSPDPTDQASAASSRAIDTSTSPGSSCTTSGASTT